MTTLLLLVLYPAVMLGIPMAYGWWQGRSVERPPLPSVEELEAENERIDLLLEELGGVMYEGRLIDSVDFWAWEMVGHGRMTREWSPIKPRSVPYFLRDFVEIRIQIPREK